MIQRCPFVPDNYICAAELAKEMGTSVRRAQQMIHRVPDRCKVRVGRSIYAPFDALRLWMPRGNPLTANSLYQSYVATCRWGDKETAETLLHSLISEGVLKR